MKVNRLVWLCSQDRFMILGMISMKFTIKVKNSLFHVKKHFDPADLLNF